MNLQKAKVWQNKKYRRFVASLECCVAPCHSDRDTVVPHHVEERKRDDLTIPVCYTHHLHQAYGIHSMKRECFEALNTINIDDIIKQTQDKWRKYNVKDNSI